MVNEEVIFRNPRNAAENVVVREIAVDHLCSWEAALTLVRATDGWNTMTQSFAGFYLHFRSGCGRGELLAAVPLDDATGRAGRFRLCLPRRTYAQRVHAQMLYQLVASKVLCKLGGTTGVARAQREWQRQTAQASQDGSHLEKFALMNGSVFSIWHNVRQVGGMVQLWPLVSGRNPV